MSLNLNRVDMPNQDPKERSKNFKEVSIGFSESMAIEEAERCLNCKNPKCREGCPVHVNIPKFIQEIKRREYDNAYTTLKQYNLLPAVCGRVCPQENQCEGACILNLKGGAIGIGRLERFVADKYMSSGKTLPIKNVKKTGKKVAILGGGPAGLTCAYELIKMGHGVTIFEALHTMGGVLMYGIPEFRLPKSIVQQEIDYMKKMGVKMEVNSVAGSINSVEELIKEKAFDSVFIATGAGLPYFLNIPGETYNEVYAANEFLTRVNLMKAYDFPNHDTPVVIGEKVAVIGAGNVAMDAARTAKRLGAKEVRIVYRRSRDEVPARLEELEHAEEEGIILNFLTSPVEILGDNETGKVIGLKCLKYKLCEPGEDGRKKPIVIEGSEFELSIDMVVIAIGQGPNPLLLEKTKGLELNNYGNIITDEKGHTSLKGVFAGGDIVTGAATVILAMGAGKNTAIAINDYLLSK